MGATVKITGSKEVQAYIKGIVKTLPKEVDKMLEAGVRNMVRDAKEAASDSVDQGFLKGQITAKKNGELDWSMVSGASYSPFIEFGTKGNYQPIAGIDASQFKGTGGDGKDFFKNILNWVRRKGIAGTYSVKTRRRTGKIDRQKQDEQLAFAIMMSIKEHGVKAHPFFFKQFDKHAPAIIKAVNQVIEKAAHG
jgi:hypothetical protein